MYDDEEARRVRAAHYAAVAERLRSIAQGVKTHFARTAMLSTAAGYEALALAVAKRAPRSDPQT
jgi:hypothetical protein